MTVETQAVIHGQDIDVTIRFAEVNGSALFIKPERLDGDGEFRLSIDDLLKALDLLGIDVQAQSGGLS